MQHQKGDCAGWRPGPYVLTMCKFCHKRQNPTTRQGEDWPSVPQVQYTHTPINYQIPELRPKCIHLGSWQSSCPCGDAQRDVHHCDCEGNEATRCWRSPLYVDDKGPLADVVSCERCRHYNDGMPEPSVGVVIGSYNLPKLIALQVKLIRDHCGEAPILIVDDCSDGYGHTPGPDTICGQLRAIVAANKNVTLFMHPVRFGHASGDLSKVWTGLQWAQARGIRILATLSQRLIIDRSRWLQDGARELLRSGHSISGRPCTDEGPFPIRSEAMLLDVDRWCIPSILDHLMPRRLTPIPGEWGVAAELVYNDSLRDRIDGKMHPWAVLGTARYQQHPGIVWHCANSPDDYRQLAARYGLTLDDGFTTSGWRQHQGASYQG